MFALLSWFYCLFCCSHCFHCRCCCCCHLFLHHFMGEIFDFSKFNASRCAKKRRCFDCIYIWCRCVNIFDFYAPIETQIFPSESRFAFIIFAFMKTKKLGNVPSIPIIIIFSFFSFTIRESKWNDNKIKIVSISWFAERELYLSRALQTCIFF